MSTCPDCRRDNPAYAEFCHSCGAKLPSPFGRSAPPPHDAAQDASDQSAKQITEMVQQVKRMREEYRQHRNALAAVLSVFMPGLGLISLGHGSGVVWVIGWSLAVPLYIRWCLRSVDEAVSSYYTFSTRTGFLWDGLSGWHVLAGIVLITVWLGHIMYCLAREN